MRRDVRFPAHYLASINLAGMEVHGIACDVHERGLRLHLNEALPGGVRVGMRGQVLVEVAKADVLEFNGEVRHITGASLGLRLSA